MLTGRNMQLTLAGVGLTSLGYILGRGVTRFFSSSAKKKSKAYPPTQLWDPKFLSNIDAFIFDCDGVLWRGAYPIKGAAATLNKLKAMNKKVMFVTNNSTKSRAQYVSKLATYNLIAEEQDVFSASYAAASFLDAMPEFDKKNKKVYAIGGEGIKLEMERHGIECIAANDMFGHKHVSPQELGDMELDSSIGAVVVGLDWEVTYTKVAYATRLLRENPGCIYLSTNQDSTFPAKKGVQLPGGGTCVSMLTFASGVTPINCGKPEPWILNMALRNFNLDPARTMMVGDRLNTDVEFGQVGGLHTMLVFSGVTTPAALKESETIPTYKGTDVTALVGGLVEEEKKECVQ